MPLSLADAARINNHVQNNLAKFAASPPEFSAFSNSEVSAWRLMLANAMASYSEQFKKAAMKGAVEAGVIFDHSKEQKPAGFDEDIYVSENMRVHLTTKNGSSRLDDKKLGTTLILAGYLTQEQWDNAVAACTTKNKPSHTFTASLRT